MKLEEIIPVISSIVIFCCANRYPSSCLFYAKLFRTSSTDRLPSSSSEAALLLQVANIWIMFFRMLFVIMCARFFLLVWQQGTNINSRHILKLAQLAEMEVKHRCNQILELGFPLGGIAKLFAQAWEGDVTVVMPATLAQVCCGHSFSYFKIFLKHVSFEPNCK